MLLVYTSGPWVIYAQKRQAQLPDDDNLLGQSSGSYNRQGQPVSSATSFVTKSNAFSLVNRELGNL